jgi:hypothetical protein
LNRRSRPVISRRPRISPIRSKSISCFLPLTHSDWW